MLAFVEGRLGSSRKRRVLAHVDECDSCRRLAALIAGDEAAEPDTDEELEPPPSVREIGPGSLVDGRFRVGAPLGRGATGAVFRATDERLGAEVALKLTRRGVHGDRATARELVVGRRITHPHVCRLHDAGSTATMHYLTMELIEGETLAQRLTREELSLTEALVLLEAVLAGLAAVHEQGIVHRDLKPANVMIEEGTGRVVITDFGFATSLDSKQSRRLVGTPAYWSPEQARGEGTTPASDIYSFGVLAYRLLTGSDFRMSDRDALVQVPRRLRRFVGRCVAARPTDRFVNAAAAALALRRAQHAATPIRRIAAALATAAAAALVLTAGKPGSAPTRAAVAPDAPTGPTLAAPTETARRRGEPVTAASTAAASADATNAVADAGAAAPTLAPAPPAPPAPPATVAASRASAGPRRPATVAAAAQHPTTAPRTASTTPRTTPAKPATDARSDPSDGDLLFRR